MRRVQTSFIGHGREGHALLALAGLKTNTDDKPDDLRGEPPILSVHQTTPRTGEDLPQPQWTPLPRLRFVCTYNRHLNHVKMLTTDPSMISNRGPWSFGL